MSECKHCRLHTTYGGDFCSSKCVFDYIPELETALRRLVLAVEAVGNGTDQIKLSALRAESYEAKRILR